MSSKIDLNLLPIINVLYETGSVTKAAQKLGVSQPAVSKSLAKLRSALGDQLFIKTPEGMKPTAKAAAMLAPIQEILSSVQDQIISSVSFDPTTAHTTFNVALSEVGELLLLPLMVKQLSAIAPHARVNSVYFTHDELIKGLANGSIDVAIGVYPELQEKYIYSQRLAYSSISCLLHTDHPFRGTHLSLEQYCNLQHVAVNSGHSDHLVQKALQSGALRSEIVLMTSHYLIVPEIVKQTGMLATLITNLARYFASAHTHLRVVEPPPIFPPVEIRQYWHRKYINEQRSKWLRAFIQTSFHRISQPGTFIEQVDTTPLSGI